MCLNRYKMSIYMITRRFRAYITWAINLAIKPTVIRFNRKQQTKWHTTVDFMCVWNCINSIFNLCTIWTLKFDTLEDSNTACCSSNSNTIKLIKPNWTELNWIELMHTSFTEYTFWNLVMAAMRIMNISKWI